MSIYGFEIVQTFIVDIEPDKHVKKAMNEINAGKFSAYASKMDPVLQVLFSLRAQNFHQSITAHTYDLCGQIGAFGGTDELHLLLDRCMGHMARGTCCPRFLLCFENRVNYSMNIDGE
uniref:Uncharacterized protein n=1 Tax=Tanacetum cinerariifolium TaxID=118510 RepID=A0A6L2JEV7_TANCI|nr:hypothetical protein [Tanacetum cinerariifolium]